MKKENILEKLELINTPSAWSKGVKNYAIDLVDGVETDELELATLESVLLNGADNWSAYSYGGSALIYDYQIAEALCTPSELKRKDGGRLQPNSRENWLDVQARALTQAYRIIRWAIKKDTK